ncbi:restriction endonuclease subunit S [Streptococcus sanguinis]|uniref:EcoKI restriction-modification system protein HsdS n=1 Tax=Streptococcus sanguinis TaxID=1305 RepID=A0A427Z5L6_STRSA|nr:restriction endonuclease subunit S [Streptococcus sanguinis]RSI07949.1 EcoKI restriction-modification system protein HsdS [Streptococcus sanguinis]
MSEVVKLEDLCLPDQIGKYGIPAVAEDFNEEKVRYLRITDIDDFGNLLEDDKKSVSSPEIEKYILKEGDIVFARTGNSTGRTYYHEEKNGKLAFAGFLIKFSLDKSKVDPKYLKYFTISKPYKQWVDNLSNGSTRGNINAKTFAECPIILPSREQQDYLVRVLSSFEEKIQINNQINQELEAMAKTLYDYWFVQFDFSDQNGKPYKSSGGKMVYHPELKREIPEGWGVEKLSKIANITMGQSPKGSSYNEVGEGLLFFQGSTDFGWRFPMARQYTTEPSRMAEEDDILLSVRAPVGTLNIADTRCCIGRGLAAINSKIGANSYIFNVMQDFKKLFDLRNSVGTTFGSITKDDLYNLKIIYPPNELLMNFDQLVKSFDREIKNRSRQNQELTQLRDWLLPMLMNGQVKVE